MTKIIDYSSRTILNNNIKIICELKIPILGNEQDEVYDKRMNIISPILTNQYVNAIKEVLRSYELSPLPQKFIKNQEILIKDLPTFDKIYGIFSLNGDDIIVDADAISGLYTNVIASFLFGHEIGHKIAKYRATNELYEDIASVLGISLYGNYYAINETFADECGNMVSSKICEHGVLPVPLDKNKREGIKRLILKSVQ